MTVVYFGPRWDAPILDDAEQVETPVGDACQRCREPIVDGDQGLIRPVFHVKGMYSTEEPIHAECEAIGIIGHQYGVCHCTGYDTTSRAAAKELWARLGHTATGVRRCDAQDHHDNH